MQLYHLITLSSFILALPAPVPSPAPAAGEIIKAHTNPAEFLAIHSPGQLAKCFAFAHTPIAGNPGGCGAGGGAAAATKRDVLAPAGAGGDISAAVKQGYAMTLQMLQLFPGNAELTKALADYKTTWPGVV